MKKFFAVLGLLTLTLGLASQEAAPSPDPAAGFLTYTLADFNFPLAEAEVGAAWNQALLPGLLTSFYGQVWGGYMWLKSPRDLTTGDPTSSLGGLDDPYKYDSAYGRWAAIVLQGLVAKSPTKILLEAFAGYRGRYEVALVEAYPGTQARNTAIFSDGLSLLGNSVLTGLKYNGLDANGHDVLSGVYSELSAESDVSSYWRTTFKVKGALPLFDVAPDDKMNLLSGYVIGRVMADYAGAGMAAGTNVPLYVDTSFGGWKFGGNAGEEIRGYKGLNLSSTFKAVGNAEFRLIGPALFGFESVYPLALVFVDTAYYSGFIDSPNHSSDSGFVATTGAAVAVNALGIGQVGARVVMPVVHTAIPAQVGQTSVELMLTWKF